MLRLDVLGKHQDGGAGVVLADRGRRQHAFVLVIRRHPDVGHGQVGFMLGDNGQQRISVAHPGYDLVTSVLEQSREAFSEENGVLGDNDTHGRTASSRVQPQPQFQPRIRQRGGEHSLDPTTLHVKLSS
jgi:hypothetical protein